jgi:uncharacterized BrkB/YihY/UPF0761 family membrane protein
VRLRKRALVTKFFADRGTHLAAMVAYFALLSFVPLIFISLSLLGFAHRADASDFLVRELSRAFPSTSIASILKLVRNVQDNATTLGIIGAVALLWSSLSLFSALESAFTVSIAVSLVGVFVFLFAVYWLLPTADVTRLDALPGAIAASVVLEASFQVVPVFVRLADVNPVLRALGGPAILLLWLFVMANVIVLGAELNWWMAERRGLGRREPEPLDGLA